MTAASVWIIPCPRCSYELRLRDLSFLGRRGRCPKCSHKFVLELSDTSVEKQVDSARGRDKSANARAEVMRSITATISHKGFVTLPSPTADDSAEPEARSNLPSETDTPLLTFPPGRPEPKWNLPDALSLRSTLVITIGAATGALTAFLIYPDGLSSYKLQALTTLGAVISSVALCRSGS